MVRRIALAQTLEDFQSLLGIGRLDRNGLESPLEC
jgi:hypothetical protein